jgi:hypothetical protein
MSRISDGGFRHGKRHRQGSLSVSDAKTSRARDGEVSRMRYAAADLAEVADAIRSTEEARVRRLARRRGGVAGGGAGAAYADHPMVRAMKDYYEGEEDARLEEQETGFPPTRTPLGFGG